MPYDPVAAARATLPLACRMQVELTGETWTPEIEQWVNLAMRMSPAMFIGLFACLAGLKSVELAMPQEVH